MSPASTAALAGLCVVIVCWLAIAALPPGRARERLAALGANGLFLTLAGWFVRLALDARADGRTWLLVPFGFFAVTFSGGLVLSLYRTGVELFGRDEGERASATN